MSEESKTNNSKTNNYLARLDALKEKVKDFPLTPGVYIMKNELEKIIYIGKAKALKNRVRSYLTDRDDHSRKTRYLIKNIFEIEYILTKTEVEAFLLEASMIKKHRPKYNIRLKDDKSYPYIRLSWSDKFPRLYLSRKVKKDGDYYFGPYTSGGAVWSTIRFLNRTFKVRDCMDAVFKIRTRPCMTYQIGRCTAPCVKLISETDYKADLENVKDFLKGKNKKVVSQLNQRMKQASEEERFEAAAKLRDSVAALKTILERQSVVNDSVESDQDAISFYSSDQGTMIQTLHIRQGRVLGTRSFFFSDISETDDQRDFMISFMNQYYEDNIIPDEIMLSIDLGLELNNLMENVLFERADHKVKVRFATDPKSRELVEMASTNALTQYQKQVSKTEEKNKALMEIRDKLGLPKIPFRIECYDISHFQGAETVASQVVFEEGVPNKDQYRRYKIKTVDGVDDFKSMYEVLSRRFKHDEIDEPELIVVDGGKGQLSQAEKVLKEIGKTHIPIVGLAKARVKGSFDQNQVESTEERFYLPGRQNPVVFKSNSLAYQILVSLRDEAHRFAITYHRKLREATSLESELDFITGLGEKRKKELLLRFKSLDDIRQATADDIAAVKGFNLILAERVLLQLNEENDTEDSTDSDK